MSENPRNKTLKVQIGQLTRSANAIDDDKMKMQSHMEETKVVI